MLFCYEKNPRWSHRNQSKHSKILHLVWNIVNFVSCLSLSQGFWCCKRKMRRIAWVLEGCSQAVWGLVFAPTWFAAELIIRKFLLIKRQPLDERLLSRLTRHVHDWWLCLCVRAKSEGNRWHDHVPCGHEFSNSVWEWRTHNTTGPTCCGRKKPSSPNCPSILGNPVLGRQGQFSNQLGYIMVYWGMVLYIPRIQTTLVLIEKALVL